MARVDDSPGLVQLLLRELVGLVAPPLCLGCGIETWLSSQALCADCHAGLPRLSGGCCRLCAQPLPCAPCPGVGAPWSSGWAALEWEGAARNLVSSAKRTGAGRVVGLLAHELVDAAPVGAWSGAAVVAVPQHPRRWRRTGVDHAGQIADRVAGLTGRPRVSCLVRAGSALRQAGASLAERTEPGRIRIEAIRAAPRRAVLVDDVWTSGTTLAAAAAALRRNGCEDVTVAAAVRSTATIDPVPGSPGW